MLLKMLREKACKFLFIKEHSVEFEALGTSVPGRKISCISSRCITAAPSCTSLTTETLMTYCDQGGLSARQRRNHPLGGEGSDEHACQSGL